MTDTAIRHLYPRSLAQRGQLEPRELGVLIEAHTGRKAPTVGPTVRQKAVAAGWLERGNTGRYELTALGRSLLPKSPWTSLKPGTIVYHPGSHEPVKVVAVYNDGYTMDVEVGQHKDIFWFNTHGHKPFETRKDANVSAKTRRGSVVVTIQGVATELSSSDADRLRLELGTALAKLDAQVIKKMLRS
jgi:hypothetical protein